jgi:glutathione S-transferase
MIGRQMAERTWAAGEAFGIADCAAAPALLLPFSETHPNIATYFERLLERPFFQACTGGRPTLFPHVPA